MALLRAAWAPPLNIILKALSPLPTQEIGPDALSLSHMEVTHHGQGVFPHIESEISHRESQLRNLSAEQGRGKAAVAKANPLLRPTLPTPPGMSSVPAPSQLWLSNALG